MSEIKNILLDMMPDFEDFLSFPALLLIQGFSKLLRTFLVIGGDQMQTTPLSCPNLYS